MPISHRIGWDQPGCPLAPAIGIMHQRPLTQLPVFISPAKLRVT
jgi:hypothetical protein